MDNIIQIKNSISYEIKNTLDRFGFYYYYKNKKYYVMFISTYTMVTYWIILDSQEEQAVKIQASFNLAGNGKNILELSDRLINKCEKEKLSAVLTSANMLLITLTEIIFDQDHEKCLAAVIKMMLTLSKFVSDTLLKNI